MASKKKQTKQSAAPTAAQIKSYLATDAPDVATTWEDTDRIGAHLVQVTNDIVMIETRADTEIAALQDKINQVKAAREGALEPLTAQRDRYQAEIQRFCLVHQADLPKDRKTFKRPFFTAALRKTPGGWKLTRSVDEVVDALINLGAASATNVKKSLRKTELGKVDAETRRKAGVLDPDVTEEITVKPILSSVPEHLVKAAMEAGR